MRASSHYSGIYFLDKVYHTTYLLHLMMDLNVHASFKGLKNVALTRDFTMKLINS